MDCFSGSCLQNVVPGHEVSEATARDFSGTFFWKKGQFNASFNYFESRRKETVILLRSAAMLTRTLRFGNYGTIVLGPQQPSLETIAASVFHSTNSTADGSRPFS